MVRARMAERIAGALGTVDPEAAFTVGLFSVLDALMSNNTLVPIITSGAARSPDFPDTPTISEVTGGPTLDFTTSVSAFASRAMNDALAERLTRAFLAAGQASEAVMAATRMNFPLQVDGPEVVKETLERDRRVAMRYREILERTP